MRLAWILGLAGLLPFVLGLSATINGSGAIAGLGEPMIILGLTVDGPRLLLSYGAVILSFMGAIHWGSALQQAPVRSWLLAVSVLPALYGWMVWGLSLINPDNFPLALLSLGLGFVGLLIFDVIRGREGAFPRWYTRLRMVLTTGVAACLSFAALYQF
ncbi:MAG: DUF3429 domain-containing protein [Rhodospirillaceae bacterium]|nr:MAG: DUF3429 domain-containing protein [Rhodospirillaceae bacterium]